MNEGAAVLLHWVLAFSYLAMTGLAVTLGPRLLAKLDLISYSEVDSNSWQMLFFMFWPFFLLVLVIWKCVWPVLEYVVPLILSKGWVLIVAVVSSLVQICLRLRDRD